MKSFYVLIFILTFSSVKLVAQQVISTGAEFIELLGKKNNQQEYVITKNLDIQIVDGSIVTIQPDRTLFIKSTNNSRIILTLTNTDDQKISLLTLKNVHFSGFNQFVLRLNNQVEVIIDSCIFQNFFSQSLKIEYGSEVQTEVGQSKVELKNNTFTKTANYPTYAGSTNHIYVSRYLDLKGSRKKNNAVFVENVHITKNRFHFLYTDSALRHMATAITFYKVHSEDYFRNISIAQNDFELNNDTACYYPAMGIVFSNMHDHYGTGAERAINLNVFDSLEVNGVPFRPTYLQVNDSIRIADNVMKTQSKRTREAIFIHGPYQSLQITGNTIDGYGAYIWNKAAQQAYTHGAVELYGGRDKGVNGANRLYSDDFYRLLVSGNTIRSRSAGIRITGAHESEISHNTITLLQDPLLLDGTSPDNKAFTKHRDSVQFQNNKIGIMLSTGGWDVDSRSSSNVRIAHNVIHTQQVLPNTDGIHVYYGRSIEIESNTIHGITGYGIYANYALRENQLNQLVTYSIKNNVIDYDIELFNRRSRFIAHDAFFASRLSGIRLFSKMSIPLNPELVKVKDQIKQSNFILAPVNAQQVLFDSFFMDDVTVE